MKEKRKYVQTTIEDKKKHAIIVSKLKARMKAIGMTRYAKEFPEIESYKIANIMAGVTIDFEFIKILEKKIAKIEKIVSDNR